MNHSNNGRDLKYIPADRIEQIEEVFEALKIPLNHPKYPGAEEFSKNLKKASNLDFENYYYTTSGSSVDPSRN